MMLHQKSYLRTISLLTSLVIIMLVAVSCLKDKPETLPNSMDWDPSVAFPLGEESFGLDAVSGFDTSLFDLDTITGFPDCIDEL